MKRRSGWRGLVLALSWMLATLPAMAGERAAGGAGKSRFGEVWATVVRWVVPAGWWEKLGPGMDPNGLTREASPRELDHLGPEMDPDG